MTTFEIILSMSAVLQVCVLAMINHTLVDIRNALGSVGEPVANKPDHGRDVSDQDA